VYGKKDLKRFRFQQTRKISREATNTDLINRLLLSSDPPVCGLKKKEIITTVVF